MTHRAFDLIATERRAFDVGFAVGLALVKRWQLTKYAVAELRRRWGL